MALDIEGIKKEATVKMRKSLPSLVFTLIAAVLIWVFGNLVFMPLAEGITLWDFQMSDHLLNDFR